MAYEKAKKEREWLCWKNREEEKMRELGVDEAIIQQLHAYDWAVFNKERQYLQRRIDSACLEWQSVEASPFSIVDMQSVLDDIDNPELLRVLLALDKVSLEIIFFKMVGYSNPQIAQKLNLSVTNVETKLWRIRKKLKKFN